MVLQFSAENAAFSDPEEVRAACIQILEGANKKSALKGLGQSPFAELGTVPINSV